MNGKINPAILMINVHAGCGGMRMPNDIRERLPGDAVHSSASLLRNCLKIIRQRELDGDSGRAYVLDQIWQIGQTRCGVVRRLVIAQRRNHAA